MRIRLVSHASVLIESGDVNLWCDPWLAGRAFNDSWELAPPAAWEPLLLDRVSHLWISHEHPDHFHIPTLRALPEGFKRRVEVLFQKNNSDKVPRALASLGFERVRTLPHRAIERLTDATAVYCYQEAQVNSCLAVIGRDATALNVNDAEIRRADCRTITRDIGPVAVVLNQFSLAGYTGDPDRATRLTHAAARVLQNVVDNHADLGARCTIPFASFVRFCTADNDYMNAFANRPADVVRALATRGLDAVVLYPGDVWDSVRPDPHQTRDALRRFADYESVASATPRAPSRSVPMETLRETFARLADDLHRLYPRAVLALLRPVCVRIPDLDVVARFSLARRSFERVDANEEADLEVWSQPLWFAFSAPFGVQTLSISARVRVLRNARNWALHRVLFAMYNAEVYLRPEMLFSRANLAHLRARLGDGPRQIARRLAHMEE